MTDIWDVVNKYLLTVKSTCMPCRCTYFMEMRLMFLEQRFDTMSFWIERHLKWTLAKHTYARNSRLVWKRKRVIGERMQPDKISWSMMLKSMSKPKKRQREKLLLLHLCVRQCLRLQFFPKSLVTDVCLLACEGRARRESLFNHTSSSLTMVQLGKSKPLHSHPEQSKLCSVCLFIR